MLNIINDVARFPEAMGGGRVFTKVYNTYPYAVTQSSIALQGFDYGFSDTEGMFFRCTIESKCEILSPYRVRITVTFGLRSREFDKRTDATISYSVLLNQTYKP